MVGLEGGQPTCHAVGRVLWTLTTLYVVLPALKFEPKVLITTRLAKDMAQKRKLFGSSERAELPLSGVQAEVLVDCGKRLHPMMPDEPAGWQGGSESGERGALWLAATSLH